MRTVRILVGAAGAIIALIALALLSVWWLVNPNDYKGRIADSVKESTGRELVLKGDIKLSVFPWIALELGPASLGNPPGFGEEPFLAFNHAAVRVKLLPLLSKRLEIDRVELDGLDLRLRKNAQGKGNWQDFGTAKKPASGSDQTVSGPLPTLAGVRVTQGRLSYQDMVVDKLNFETGAFRENGVTPVSIAFDARRGVPGENLSLRAQFDLSVDAQLKRLRIAAVSLNGLLARAGDGAPVPWDMSAPAIVVDLNAQTAAVPAFTLSYSTAHLSGKLQATKIIDDLAVTGSAALAPLVLGEFAPRFGVVLPKTRDPRAFRQLALSSDFSYSPSGVRLERVQAQLDDTHLKGSAAFVGEPRALKFELTVDKIDVDRYLSPDTGTAAPARKTAAEPKSGAPAEASTDMDGTLSLASVHFSPLDLSNVRVTLSSRDNVMHLYPLLAQIDGGSYTGNITLDRRGATPVLNLDEHLSGIDMARLLAGTAYKGRVSGHGNVNLKATAHGAEFNAVMQTLDGHFDANLADGALEGIDLGYEVGLAQALIKHTPEPKARSGPARTSFDAFKMSAQIANGLARTSDLVISSPVVRVTAQGTANLVNKALDLQMLASALKTPGVSAADIPLKITGTYVEPVVRPDAESLAKGALKQKLQEVLKKNGLEGLFGK